jgi:hypothetical protein
MLARCRSAMLIDAQELDLHVHAGDFKEWRHKVPVELRLFDGASYRDGAFIKQDEPAKWRRP